MTDHRFAPGDHSRAICETCARVVQTTFKVRDIPFSEGTGVARGVLAACCDDCGEVVATPAQSMPAIATARAVNE